LDTIYSESNLCLASDNKDGPLDGSIDTIDVLLVIVPFDSTATPGASKLLPMGIILLGTILRKAGYKVKILTGPNDVDYESKLDKIISEQTPLFIGFSVMTPQVGKAYELSQHIKEMRPDIPILWGGFHPTIFPDMTIDDPNVDIVAYGEGASLIAPLAKAIQNNDELDHIEGILFKRDGKVVRTEKPALVELVDLPGLDWDLIDRDVLENFIVRCNPTGQDVRALPILTGLGCQFLCTFCHNVIFKQTHRTLPSESIIQEMKRLRDKYDLNEVGFVDENFFGDRPRFFKLIELLEEEKLGVQWSSTMRASDIREKFLNEKILRRMFLAGGYYFGIGAESGSPQILRRLKKGISVEHILDAAKYSCTSGITFTFSFMAGLPGEDIDDVFMTMDLINQIYEINPKLLLIGPQLFRPYPGSELYDQALEHGLTAPTSLKAWSKDIYCLDSSSHSRRLDVKTLPWLPQPEFFEKVMLCFYVSCTKRDFWRVPVLYLLPLRLMQWIAEIRIKKRLFKFMPEAFLYRLINNRMS
jgi:anaerobic magnesium-protoporphyrin IX monomethyl ester cyclase